MISPQHLDMCDVPKTSFSEQLHQQQQFGMYSTDRTQPNTRANPGFSLWVHSEFAFRNFAFTLGSPWVYSGLALGPLRFHFLGDNNNDNNAWRIL
jgi:hypothetical protein